MFSYLNAPPALNPSSQWAYNIAPNQASFYNDAPNRNFVLSNAPTRRSVYDDGQSATYSNAPNPAHNRTPGHELASGQASYFNYAPSRNSGYNAPTRSSVYDNSHNATYFNGPNPAQNLTPGHNMAPNQALFYNIAPQRLPFETLDPLPRHVAFKF